MLGSIHQLCNPTANAQFSACIRHPCTAQGCAVLMRWPLHLNSNFSCGGELWLLGCCWGPKLWHVLQLHTLIMFASRPTAAARIHPACVPESLLQAQDKVRCFVRRFCMCVNSKMFCCACYDDDDIIERKTQMLLLVLSMFVVLLLPPSTLFWVLLPLHIPQG